MKYLYGQRLLPMQWQRRPVSTSSIVLLHGTSHFDFFRPSERGRPFERCTARRDIHRVGSMNGLRSHIRCLSCTSRRPANTAFYLVTMNGMTFNQTLSANLSVNPTLLSTIAQINNQLLCSNQTQIIPLQNSIQDFHVPCPIPQL